MEMSSIANAVMNAQNAQTAAQASVMILRKSLDIQAESAIGLIQAIPDIPQIASNPPNLGNVVDVMA